jgi:hemolysin III
METLDTSFVARLEEIANSVSHGIGLLAVLISAPFLLLATARHGNTFNDIGVAIFMATLALLYLASTLYHGLPHGKAKQFFLKLDYCAIFLVIAGSYTAFISTLELRVPHWQLGLVWGMAGLGLLLKLFDKLSHPVHSTGYYVAVGWLTLIAALQVAEHVPAFSLYWIIAGAIVYSCGVLVYFFGSRLRFSHLGWHVLVMLGSGCHVIALFRA